MSLEVTRYYLDHSPQYIMNTLAAIANPIHNSRPNSPITPAFILRPVSPAAAVSPITDRSTSVDEDGIPNGIDIADDTLAMPLSAKHTQETPLQAQVGRSWF